MAHQASNDNADAHPPRPPLRVMTNFHLPLVLTLPRPSSPSRPMSPGRRLQAPSAGEGLVGLALTTPDTLRLAPGDVVRSPSSTGPGDIIESVATGLPSIAQAFENWSPGPGALRSPSSPGPADIIEFANPGIPGIDQIVDQVFEEDPHPMQEDCPDSRGPVCGWTYQLCQQCNLTRERGTERHFVCVNPVNERVAPTWEKGRCRFCYGPARLVWQTIPHRVVDQCLRCQWEATYALGFDDASSSLMRRFRNKVGNVTGNLTKKMKPRHAEQQGEGQERSFPGARNFGLWSRARSVTDVLGSKEADRDEDGDVKKPRRNRVSWGVNETRIYHPEPSDSENISPDRDNQSEIF